MLTNIQKWGNSLAVRIPKSFAKEVNLETDSLVEITIRDSQILIKPATYKWTLDQLLTKVHPDNLHNEIDSGTSVGNETW